MSHKKCVAIILAGGKSQRMGLPKGLLDYNGHFWLLEHFIRLKAGGIKEIIIGLGYKSDTYYKAIPELQKALNSSIFFKGLQVSVVQNENPKLGSFSTLQYALKAHYKSSDVLICPIDVPILNSKELKKLIKTNANIVKPIFKGQSGHPIKIKYQFVERLLNEDSTSRLDKLIALESDIKKIPCIDNQIIMNLNTPVDWSSFKDRSPV
jgi:CTP:molybdopterin cytidylyltransferase MocA